MSLFDIRQIAWTCVNCSFGNELRFQRPTRHKTDGAAAVPQDGAQSRNDLQEFPSSVDSLECRQCGFLAALCVAPRGVFPAFAAKEAVESPCELETHQQLASLQRRAQLQLELIQDLNEQLRALEADAAAAESAAKQAEAVEGSAAPTPNSAACGGRRSSWSKRLLGSLSCLARPARRRHSTSSTTTSAAQADDFERWRSGVRAQLAAEAEAAKQRRAAETPEERRERVRKHRDRLLRRRLKEAEAEIEKRRKRDAEASANSPLLPRRFLLSSAGGDGGSSNSPWSCGQLRAALPAEDRGGRGQRSGLSNAADMWSRGAGSSGFGGGRGGGDLWSGAFAPVVSICRGGGGGGGGGGGRR